MFKALKSKLDVKTPDIDIYLELFFAREEAKDPIRIRKLDIKIARAWTHLSNDEKNAVAGILDAKGMLPERFAKLKEIFKGQVVQIKQEGEEWI